MKHCESMRRQQWIRIATYAITTSRPSGSSSCTRKQANYKLLNSSCGQSTKSTGEKDKRKVIPQVILCSTPLIRDFLRFCSCTESSHKDSANSFCRTKPDDLLETFCDVIRGTVNMLYSAHFFNAVKNEWRSKRWLADTCRPFFYSCCLRLLFVFR